MFVFFFLVTTIRWKKKMSYSFLEDVFPAWKEQGKKDIAAGVDLYEDFDASSTNPMPQPSSEGVHGILAPPKDLLNESFTDYNLPLEKTSSGPQPFDGIEDDYFQLLSENWTKTTGDYQAAARIPFSNVGGNNNYVEESPIDRSATTATESCMDVAKHLDYCKDCKSRLEHIFKKLMDTSTASSTHVAASATTTTTQDIILLVAIGVFIIFVLDAFVRLGRYLAK